MTGGNTVPHPGAQQPGMPAGAIQKGGASGPYPQGIYRRDSHPRYAGMDGENPAAMGMVPNASVLPQGIMSSGVPVMSQQLQARACAQVQVHGPHGPGSMPIGCGGVGVVSGTVPGVGVPRQQTGHGPTSPLGQGSVHKPCMQPSPLHGDLGSR